MAPQKPQVQKPKESKSLNMLHVLLLFLSTSLGGSFRGPELCWSTHTLPFVQSRWFGSSLLRPGVPGRMHHAQVKEYILKKNTLLLLLFICEGRTMNSCEKAALSSFLSWATYREQKVPGGTKYWNKLHGHQIYVRGHCWKVGLVARKPKSPPGGNVSRNMYAKFGDDWMIFYASKKREN